MLPAVAALLLVLPTAEASLPVELPPGEDPAVWEPALQMARQLLPELALGPALGPGPSVRIVAGEGSWLLDVAGDHGHSAPLPMPIPDSEEARTELLVFCADLLTRSAAPPRTPPPVTPPPPPPTPPSAWRWVPPRVDGAVRILPSDAALFDLALEPSGVGWRALALAPRFFVASPTTLTEKLDLGSAGVALALRGQVGPRPLLCAGLLGGLRLRSLRRNGAEVLRDWSFEVGGSGGVGLPLPWHLAALLEAQAVAAVPPTEVVTSEGAVPLPSFSLRLAVVLALRHEP